MVRCADKGGKGGPTVWPGREPRGGRPCAGVSNRIAGGFSLSSDMMGDLPGSTFHADFWNTSDQSAVEQLALSQLNS